MPQQSVYIRDDDMELWKSAQKAALVRKALRHPDFKQFIAKTKGRTIYRAPAAANTPPGDDDDTVVRVAIDDPA